MRQIAFFQNQQGITMRKSAPPRHQAALDISGKLRQFFDALASTAEGLAEAEGGQTPFSLAGKDARAVFGYTVRVGLDGLKAERFGDAPPPRRAAEPTPAPPAARAPIVDVFEEGDTLRILAELPGADTAEINCSAESRAVHIATTGAHVYRKTVPLPHAVDPASLTQSCRNGILELSLRLAVAS
jgi:HSP20 family molecular chaperone IbpA